jgi:hypothetical protein
LRVTPVRWLHEEERVRDVGSARGRRPPCRDGVVGDVESRGRVTGERAVVRIDGIRAVRIVIVRIEVEEAHTVAHRLERRGENLRFGAGSSGQVGLVDVHVVIDVGPVVVGRVGTAGTDVGVVRIAVDLDQPIPVVDLLIEVVGIDLFGAVLRAPDELGQQVRVVVGRDCVVERLLRALEDLLEVGLALDRGTDVEEARVDVERHNTLR